jgi:hypothetical protein
MNRMARLCVILCFVTIPALMVADGKRLLQSLNVSDLDTDYELIGRFGHPLGTMLTIKGTWGYPDQSNGPTKVYDLQFRITEINGIPHTPPLVLDVWSVHVIDKQRQSLIPTHENHRDLNGVTWELRAFETGRYSCMPKEYNDFRGPVAMRQSPPFISELVGYMPERK